MKLQVLDHEKFKAKPVMVFIHGGGLMEGDASRYDMKKFAEENEVVAVNFNYRLGVFGFMASQLLSDYDERGQDYSGNYGFGE